MVDQRGAMSAPFSIQIETGPRRGERVPLPPGGLTIGRQPGNDLTLDEQQVSRHHAQITMRAGAIIVADLGAANGTLVNGVRISGTSTLRPGDLIQIGATALRLAPADAAIPPQPAGTSGRRWLLFGGIAALLLVLCACGTASLAILVDGRGGTPTPEQAFEPVGTAPAGISAGVTPTPPGVSVTIPVAASVPTLASAPTTAAARPTPTVIRQAQAPSGRPASNAGGTYSGKVQRGYTITFQVSSDGKMISDVEARALTDCGTGQSSDTTFAPDATFAIGPDGTFAGQGEYQPGFRWEFAGQLSGASATGYLRDYSVVAGAVCDTRRLQWTAARQAP